MSASLIDNATAEDKYIVLVQWWQRHCKSFTEWWLGMTDDQRKKCLLKACPDMPLTTASSRKNNNTTEPVMMRATDVILPELAVESLLEVKGRIFILFMTRRCTSSTLSQEEDTTFLNGVYKKGGLPSFSNGALNALDTPFIDPTDPEEAVSALCAETSPENRQYILECLESNRLIHAEVWLALKIRRTAIIEVFVGLLAEHQAEVANKPSPTFDALLEAEMAMQAEFASKNAATTTTQGTSNYGQDAPGGAAAQAGFEKGTVEEIASEDNHLFTE